MEDRKIGVARNRCCNAVSERTCWLPPQLQELARVGRELSKVDGLE
jgi:hypothetical protein